jgi:hypothetical protein
MDGVQSELDVVVLGVVEVVAGVVVVGVVGAVVVVGVAELVVQEVLAVVLVVALVPTVEVVGGGGVVVGGAAAVVLVFVLEVVGVVDVGVDGLGRFGNAGWSQQLVGSAYGPDCGAPSKVIAIRPSFL